MFDSAWPDLKVYALPLLALVVLAMAWSRALPSWGRRALSWVLRSAVTIRPTSGREIPLGRIRWPALRVGRPGGRGVGPGLVRGAEDGLTCGV